MLAAKRQFTATIWQTDFELEVPVEELLRAVRALKVGDRMARLFDRRRRRREGEVADQHKDGWTRVAVCHRSRAWTKTEIEVPLGHYTMARNPYRKLSSQRARDSRPSCRCSGNWSGRALSATRSCTSDAGPPRKTSRSISIRCPRLSFGASAARSHRREDLRDGSQEPSSVWPSTRLVPTSMSAGRRQWWPTAGTFWNAEGHAVSTSSPIDQ